MDSIEINYKLSLLHRDRALTLAVSDVEKLRILDDTIEYYLRLNKPYPIIEVR